MKFVTTFILILLSMGIMFAQDADTSLHAAVWNKNLEQAKKILETGYNIETKNSNDQTAFYVACLINNVEIAKYLAEKGANVVEYSLWNMPSPKELSIKNNNVELFKLIVAKDIIPEEEKTNPSSDYAVFHDLDTLYLLNLAASEGQIEIFKYLFETFKIDISKKEVYELLSSAISANRLEIIKYLVGLGFHLNDFSEDYTNPVILAAETSTPETIRLLIELGAKQDSSEYYTPLYSAVYANQEDNAILLMEYDCKILKDTSYTMGILADLGENHMNKLAKQLIEKIGDLSTYKSKELNPLNKAIVANNLEFVDLMIRHGVDINASDEYGETPLNNLVVNLNYYDTNFFINLNNQKYLLEKGANPNISYYGTTTPFQNLVKFCADYYFEGSSPERDSLVTLIRFYISKGGDILVSDNYGSSAFSVADDEIKQEFREKLSSKMFIFEPEETSVILDKTSELWSQNPLLNFEVGEEITIPNYFYLICKSENIEPWTENLLVESEDESYDDYNGVITSIPAIIIASINNQVSIINSLSRKILFTTENHFDSASAIIMGEKILLQTGSDYFLTDEYFSKVERNAFTNYLNENKITIPGKQKALNLNKRLLLVKTGSDSLISMIRWSEDFSKVEKIDISSVLKEVLPDPEFSCFSSDGQWLLTGQSSKNLDEYSEEKEVQFSLYYITANEKISFSKRILIGPKFYSSPKISNAATEGGKGFCIESSSDYQYNFIDLADVDSLIGGVAEETKKVLASEVFAFNSAKVRKYLRKEKDKKILSLLKTLNDPNVLGDEGLSLLHLAVRANKPEMVKLLNDNGCNVNTAGIAGITPLYLASFIKDNEETTKYLLEKGADLTKTTIYGTSVVYPATYFSFSNYLLETLKENNVDFWQMDAMKRTPLFAAIKRQKPYFDYSVFFNNGTTPQRTCNNSSSALITAIKEKNPWATSYLLSRNDVDLNYTNGNDNTPLLQAINDGEFSLAEYLIYQGVDVNKGVKEEYPLTAAAKSFVDYSLAEYLEFQGAEISDEIINEYSELSTKPDISRLLIQKGADINNYDSSGMQAIHYAAQKNNIELLKLLIEKGADIEAVDSLSNTPLMEAVVNNNNECVKILLEKGADPNYIDNESTPTIYYAIDNKNSLELMLKSGANPYIPNKEGVYAVQNALMKDNWDAAMILLGDKYRSGYPDSVISTLISSYLNYSSSEFDTNKIDTLLLFGADINYRGDEYLTIIDGVISYGTPDDISYIIRKGYNLFYVDSINTPPMVRVFENYDDETVLKIIQNLEENTRLVEPGHYTLLHLAVKNNCPMVATYLIENYPELINLQDNDGYTALHYLASQNQPEIIQKLIDAGADTTIEDNYGQKYSDILTSYESVEDYNEGSYEIIVEETENSDEETIVEEEKVVEADNVETIDEPAEAEEQGVWFVEENASFNGGDLSMFNTWVAEHVQYPADAAKAGISGKVIVQFAIDRKGNVCDVKIIRAVYPLLDAEAVRVIKSSPRWEPAKQEGKAVKQMFTIPIYFNLE